MGLRAWVTMLGALMLWMTHTRDASGGSGCAGPRVSVDEDVDTSWKDAVDDLRRSLGSLPEVDACSTIHIERAAAGIRATVALADGRVAAREVLAPSRLVASIEPLLVRLPEQAAPPAAPPAVLPPPRPAEPMPSSAPPRPDAATVEIGLGPSVQLTATPTYFGYGATGFAHVLVDTLVFEAVFRWDINDVGTGQKLPLGFNMESFMLGVRVGHRHRIGATLWDLAIGPQAHVENQEAGPGAEGYGGLYGDLSLGGVLRVLVPSTSRLRGFASLSAEVLPRRLGREVRASPVLPPLPPWGFGLSVGLSWVGL